MSAVPHQSDPAAASGDDSRGIKPIIDLSRLDLTRRMYSKDDIAKLNPHRGEMALLDWIVWETPDHRQVVGLKHIRHDEFWVPGHFPARPMFPGVLMIEAGAQLACFSFNVRQPDPKVVAFLRIDQASFRASVQPGDDLYLLCVEIKYGRRQFQSQIQGIVGDRLAFDARISGMSLSG